MVGPSQALLHCGTVVPIAPLRATALASLVDTADLLTSPQLRNDECWYNAYWLATAFEAHGVEYVEGLVAFADEAVEHAWNAMDGVHFDVTWECHRPTHMAADHFMLVKGSPAALDALGYRFDPEATTMVRQWQVRSAL